MPTHLDFFVSRCASPYAGSPTMRALHKTDIDCLAQGLTLQHGVALAELACLAQLTKTAFDHMGSLHGVNLEPMLALQRRCIDLMAENAGFSTAEVNDAMNGIVRVAKTATYLSSLPAESACSSVVSMSPKAAGTAQRLLRRVAARP